MPLVDSGSLVTDAWRNKYAVVQLNTNGGTYDLTRAIFEVAEEENSPVIFGAYEANLQYRGYEYAGMQMRFFAERAIVPIAIHLDHGHSVDACRQAIAAGFTSVMIDGSHLPIDENVRLAREAVAMMCETGIDMLAVGIGNAHGFYKDAPNIRFDMLEKYAEVATVPLVLHGSTGLADNVIDRCVKMGMAKVNLGTLLRTRCVEYTAQVIAEGKHQNHPWRVGLAVKDRLKPHIRHILKVAGSCGRAEG